MLMKYIHYMLIIACICTQMPAVPSAQILGLFQHPGKSHFDFFRPLFIGLARAGHNVTMISYFPNKRALANYTDYQLDGMPIIADIVNLQNFEESNELWVPFKIPTFFMLHDWSMQACEVAFNSNIIRNLLEKHTKWDVIIMEQFSNDCMMAIAHLLGAPPVIALSSCSMMPWHYKRMGSPFIPAYMPMNFLPYTDEMNFMARLNNFFHYHATNFLYEFHTQRATNILIRKYFGRQAIPPIEELVKKTKLMLINQHFSLAAGAYPYSPNIIEVGGLQIQDEAPLESDLQILLDNNPQGVIYISWGSMIRPETLPLHKQNVILNTIKQMSTYTFLMKWPNKTILNQPKNLQTRTWMPQRDLLCHPNVKAFITHGGLLGISEAVYCGVPMLLTPFYGDQLLNSAAMKKRKMGVIVEYSQFNEENIKIGLQRILDSNFAKNVKLHSDAFKNRPVDPLKLAIWWVEHIINTKGANLPQNTSTDMNLLILYSFDIYLILLIFTLAVIAFIRTIYKSYLRFFVRKSNRKYKSQ